MKRKNKKQQRQGDILIEEATLPPDAVKQDTKNGIILAHGEATGHYHRLETDDADWWKSADGTEQFVQPNKTTQIIHDEHGALKTPKKKVQKVIRQREYSPARFQNVRD